VQQHLGNSKWQAAEACSRLGQGWGQEQGEEQGVGQQQGNSRWYMGYPVNMLNQLVQTKAGACSRLGVQA
jgi:hypothetical protein